MGIDTKKFFIVQAKRGVTKGGRTYDPDPSVIVATIQFKEGNNTQWISMVEADGAPYVFLSDKDIHEHFVSENFESEFFTTYLYLDKHCINEFEGIALHGDYPTTFMSIEEYPDNPAVSLIQYLITLVRCDIESVDKLIPMAPGKYIYELDFQLSDVAEDFILEYYKYENYRERLTFETEIELGNDPSSYEVRKESLDIKEIYLRRYISMCKDEADYQAWKEDFIEYEYEQLKGVKFLAIKYTILGVGQFEDITPADNKDYFIEFGWLYENKDSAIYEGEREATEEEIKKFIRYIAARPDLLSSIRKKANISGGRKDSMENDSKENQIVKEWNSKHDAYATIDRYGNGPNKILVIKGNRIVSREIRDQILEELLDDAYAEIIRPGAFRP